MGRDAVLERLRDSLPLIAPSMLKCDFANLQREVQRLEGAGARVLHWDVMDGHFVPNLSYGAPLIERLRPHTSVVFDAHLMISDPARYLDDFLRAGCNCLTFHIEAVPDPVPLLRHIRNAEAVAGLALNPGTPVEAVAAALPECDLVLVMSVEPGFGGQKFMPVSLEKLRSLRARAGRDVLLGIDGGIGPETIAETARAGADLFVVGSAIFEADDYGSAIRGLAARAGGRQQASERSPDASSRVHPR